MVEHPSSKLPTIIHESSAQNHESARAKWWRTNVVKLTVQELADLTGYSIKSIYLMERGISSQGEIVARWVFQRYKLTCAGVQAQLDQGRPFEWK